VNKVNKLETVRKAQIIKGQGEKHDGLWRAIAVKSRYQDIMNDIMISA